MFTRYIKLINSFDRLCPQSVLFICQPLNQQQTARCDKCDVGWGWRAGNQKKEKKKERERKNISPLPAAYLRVGIECIMLLFELVFQHLAQALLHIHFGELDVLISQIVQNRS